MRYYLQMTFIPTFPEENMFFMWLTNQKGEPCPKQEHRDWLNELLSNSDWGSYFMLEQSSFKQVILEYEDEYIEVSGRLVPMVPIYDLLQQDIFNSRSFSLFQFGESFLFWQKVAKSLHILLQNGHYYPTLLAAQKEGSTYLFSQWMLSRVVVQELDLSNDWIRSISEIVLSAVDLAPLPIRQWLDVCLDTWVDQVIRKRLDPAYDPVLKHWPDHDFFQELIPQWFYYLTQPESSYFLVTSDERDIAQIQTVAQQLESWHTPLVGSVQANPAQALIRFKEKHMQSYIEPLSLILYLEPLDEYDPFNNFTPWLVSLKVEGTKRGSTSIDKGSSTEQQSSVGPPRWVYEAEQIWFNHPSSQEWMVEKIERLVEADDQFLPLLHQIYRNDFTMQFQGVTAIRFYEEYARQLREEDIHIHLPQELEWQDWSDRHVDVYLETSTREGSALSLSSIIQFNWKIAIGALSIPVSEFRQMVSDQQRFLHHQGQWVELPLEQMLQAYEEMTEIDHQLGTKGRMADVLHLSIAQKEKSKQHVLIDTDGQAEAYLEKLTQHPNQSLAIPSSFHGQLRPYQHQGFAWLHALKEKGVGGCLADDMGLGKTIQAIAYLLSQPHLSMKNPALIICPTSLIGNWQREIQQFAPDLHVYAHHGAARHDQVDFNKKKREYDVMITSYVLAVRDAHWLSHEEWPTLILDEAQAIKNPSTKQSQVIRQLKAQHRLALTGTPMENRLEELWSIMDFLNPGYLGSLRRFRKQFITPIEKHQDQVKSKLLKKLIQPFLLRREKTDPSIIQDLPDKIEQTEICSLSTEQASLYQSVVDELMDKMRLAQGIERKGLILAALTQLKQVCDHPHLVSKKEAKLRHSGKLTRFFELIEPIFDQSQSVLVFTQYVGMGRLIQAFTQERYPDCPVFFLHGALPSTKREEMIEAFRQHHSQKALFILSLKAGGLGLNLTEANHVIHYDRWWNPAVEDQATDRAYRIGQQKNVHVYKLMTEGTLEEGIDQLIQQKRTLTEQIIGQGDGWVTELSDEEIYELIRLRERMMSECR